MRSRLTLLISTCIMVAVPLSGQQPASKKPMRGAPPEMQKLAFLVGEWEVQAEPFGPNGQPGPSFQTTSRIISRLGGAVIEESIPLPQANDTTINMVTVWSFDRFRKVYRIAYLDDTYALFDVFEGIEQDGRIVFDNLRANTSLPGPEGRPMHGRNTLADLSPDRFTITSEISFDGGKTWQIAIRGKYLRKKGDSSRE